VAPPAIGWGVGLADRALARLDDVHLSGLVMDAPALWLGEEGDENAKDQQEDQEVEPAAQQEERTQRT